MRFQRATDEQGKKVAKNKKRPWHSENIVKYEARSYIAVSHLTENLKELVNDRWVILKCLQERPHESLRNVSGRASLDSEIGDRLNDSSLRYYWSRAIGGREFLCWPALERTWRVQTAECTGPSGTLGATGTGPRPPFCSRASFCGAGDGVTCHSVQVKGAQRCQLVSDLDGILVGSGGSRAIVYSLVLHHGKWQLQIRALL